MHIHKKSRLGLGKDVLTVDFKTLKLTSQSDSTMVWSRPRRCSILDAEGALAVCYRREPG